MIISILESAALLRIHYILIRIKSISFRFTYLLNKSRIFKFFSFFFFSLIFILKLDEPFRKKENFCQLNFFNSSDLESESKKLFFMLQYLVGILSHESGSVDPHIFADRTYSDPDPKHQLEGFDVNMWGSESIHDVQMFLCGVGILLCGSDFNFRGSLRPSTPDHAKLKMRTSLLANCNIA